MLFHIYESSNNSSNALLYVMSKGLPVQQDATLTQWQQNISVHNSFIALVIYCTDIWES